MMKLGKIKRLLLLILYCDITIVEMEDVLHLEF